MGASTEELTSDIDATRQSLSRGIDELSDKVSPSRAIHRQKEAAVSRLGSIRDQVMGTASDAPGAVTDTATSAADSLQGAAHGAVRTAQGNPLAAGLAAFGIGLVLASLIPASRQEARIAHAAVETAKEQGAPVLQEGAEKLKEAASQAAQDLQGSAQEAVSHVGDEAASAAGAVKDDVQSASVSVKEAVADQGGSPS